MVYHSEGDLKELGDKVSKAALDALDREERGGPSTSSPTWDARPWYSQLAERFTVFSVPDPRNANHAISELETLALQLNPDGLTDVSGSLSGHVAGKTIRGGERMKLKIDDVIDTLIEYWHGDASDNFRRNYLYKLKYAGMLQGYVADTLRVSLEASKKLRLSALDDIWHIGHKAIDCLNALGRAKVRDTIVAVTVAEAVVSILAAVPTGGASIAAGVLAEATEQTVSRSAMGVAKDIGFAANNAAKNLREYDSISRDIMGPTSFDVVNNMIDALTDVATVAIDTNTQITRFLSSVQDNMSSIKAPHPSDLSNLQRGKNKQDRDKRLKHDFYGTA